MSEYPPLPKTLADAVRFAICEVDDFSAINIHLDDENEMVLRAMAYIEPIIAEAILAERNRCANIAEEHVRINFDHIARMTGLNIATEIRGG